MTRFLIAAAAALLAVPASAQIAIGGQLGTPTGLSLKAGAGPGAVLLAVGFGGDGVAAEGHYVLRSRRLEGADASLRLFYGPGVFVRVDDDDDTDLGISLGVGLETLLTRDIELYGLVSPRLTLVDETDFGVGGGVGLRLRL